jgi:transketolase
VINIHTIKPLDNEAVLMSIRKTKCAVTCEEHQINGGLGESIAQVAARFEPTPIEMVAVNDSFGESGKPVELLEKYGLAPRNIVQAVENVLNRKQ